MEISGETHLTGGFTEDLSNNTKGVEPDTLEKVEELIQMKRLPQDKTITIHSPESGTTIF